MKEHTEKIYMLLTALSKVFDSKTFDIHRDTIAEILSITNGKVTLCMKSLKEKHEVIDFNITDEREYTVTLIKPSEGIYDDALKRFKECIKKLDETSLNNYKKLLERQKMKEKEAQHEGLKRFLEEKRKEQIEKANKTEMVLKEIFDKLGIVYEYQHIEIIKDENDEQHGYIYDFFVVIDGKKYDVEIDGSSHDGNEERDKERDNLTRSIGIEPIRFSTQMIYVLSYEVNKGKLNIGDILGLIVNDFSSIAKLWESENIFYNRWFDCKEENKRLQDLLIEEKDKRIQDLQGLNKTLQGLNKTLQEANKTLQDLIEEKKRLKGENKRLQDLLDVKTSQLSEAKYSISELNAILDDEEEHNSLFNAKERQKEVRDEMTRECFLLSKKNTNLPF